MKYFSFLPVAFTLLGSIAFAGGPGSTLNPGIVPAPLIKAMQDVHAVAATANLKSLFMYKYVYFNSGSCKDQDCSAETVNKSIQLFKDLMGPDFSVLNQQYDQYVHEIENDKQKSRTGDVDSLLMAKSADEILMRATFFTCVDYAKSVAKKALEAGMDPNDLRFFWLMDKAAYLKMCPTQNGQKAVAPRPLVHTIVAYRMNNQWYLMNTEKPNPEIIPLGDELPHSRLSRQFIFELPALVAGKVLTYAGNYEFAKFIDGFPGRWLANITASGLPSTDDADFVCR